MRSGRNQLYNSDSGELVETSFREQVHTGHYVNVQCEIPFQSAEEKLPAILADVFFVAYMQIYHACILSIVHVK